MGKYTFQESSDLLARAIGSINDEDEGHSFLNNRHTLSTPQCERECPQVSLKFNETHSHHYQIVYKSEDEVVESFQKKMGGLY